jgi:antitoxin ParD1/3/4
MNISLPDQMKEWVEAQVATGRYANVSDYVRDVLRREQEQEQAVADFLSLVDEGLDSGISDLTLDDIWRNAQSQATKIGTKQAG